MIPAATGQGRIFSRSPKSVAIANHEREAGRQEARSGNQESSKSS